MSDIRFYIPKSEKIPTALRLYVDDVYVVYHTITNGYWFEIHETEEKAMDIAKRIIEEIINEKDESEHGVTWRTVSLTVIERDRRYYGDTTLIEWKYRIRDSY